MIVKLTNTKSKLKSPVKNKTGTELRLNKKNFQDEELPHELFLTKRQTTEINAIAKNMLTDTKLSKAQLSKMIQSGGLLCNILENLGKKVITDLAIPLSRDNLSGLVCNLASHALSKFERKIREKGALKAVKGFTLFIVNENMRDLIKIIKSEDSNVLIDNITETVKHEIKKTRQIPDLLEF